MAKGFYRRIGKRCFDVAVAVVLLVALAPVLIAVALLVRSRLGSPILFHQLRPGLQGQPFRMIKFRTMTNTRDAEGNLLPDAERLTRFGQFLRSTSLDELPELWNVLRGEMSLVGPRPLLMAYLDRYTPEQARRHHVAPGITGWGQVNGRNSLSWEEKFQLDVWYVDHLGFLLDVSILLQTLLKVIRRDGIQAEGHATMPEFLGEDVQETLAMAPVGISISDQKGRRPVVVIGAGGHAKVVISTLRAAGYQVTKAYDDNPQRWGESVLGVPIAGPIQTAQSENSAAVIAIGDAGARRAVAETLHLEWISVVHPLAIVQEDVQIGAGTIVCTSAIIQPEVIIGEHCIVGDGVFVGHDSRVGNFVNVFPGARLAGNVTVGERTMLGLSCCVIQGVEIGSGTKVGAGAVVVRDVAAEVVVVGSPARPINFVVGERKAA